ncbi:MAG: hypothetical protein ACD_9C00071G0003 [uncultured bacterium]|nr:MAG: hypothetical protein ACD_9C00071G0003 [uncultured bacterium]KKQ45410.1 MAG: hypothetical protein US63_C0017G0009 [Candidatus Moranbacteria bacterium GW2011_GWC2_37_8]KKQ63373.1 MAG: hypothetical protein US82_C0001G0042 [Parcubacteria group bacterium GW2011_GWC1_38_22]KKQ80966.1 MAG: hypothetical protein UT03_C0015G0013 [Candidatus Moranbacteria bacterium GW2011_GWD2_38_7]
MENQTNINAIAVEKKSLIDQITQFAIPILTITSQILMAAKFPQWGLILTLMAQPFWLYSTWKSYKKAGQIGILINTILYTLVTAAGVVNYWLLK